MLVATDVAARGIDVEDVTHVINFQCPEDEKTYLHRTGRTGRAGNNGTAVTFVDWDDIPRWRLIDKALELGIPEPRETYSSSEHLYEELSIPKGTKGRLPRSRRTHEGLGAEVLEDLGEPGGRKSGPRGEGRDGRSRDRGAGRGEGRGSGRGDRGGSGRGEGRGGRGRRDDAATSSAPREDARAPRAAARETAPEAPRETSVERTSDGTTRRRRRRRSSAASPEQSGTAGE